MGRVLRFLGFAAMWAAVLGVVILLTGYSRSQRSTRCVKSLDIVIADSTERGNLVTRAMVEGMLRRGKIQVVGESVDHVPLQHIEQTISRNGFVQSAEAFINYEGVMTIEVRQRSAVLRFMADGYDCYITEDGFIFDAPSATALNTGVITGDYQPLFKSGYMGYIDDYAAAEVAKLELEIERVEREKYPIYLREKANKEDLREVRKRFINRSAFESKDEFAKRVVKVRAENQERRELCAYRQRVIDKELGALEQEQERYRERQKKVQKKCEDIYNLITFVKMVEADDFWRSEVTQIDLEEGRDGVRVNLAVRSAKFIVTLGEFGARGKGGKGEDGGEVDIEAQIEDRFQRLRNFYDEALTRVGWDRYRYINIEYKNQVVCRR